MQTLSALSVNFKDDSFGSLEARLAIEMSFPVKKYSGLNHIKMCGRHARCFMGEQPKALIFTFSMINIPATFFNAAIAPVPLWGEQRYLILTLGIILQIASTILMFYTSCIDPGIVPATLISKDAKSKVDKKYINIKHKN